MEIEIYADMVFFINFIMDFFIFWIVSKLVKNRICLLRLILGAFTASILYCMLIFIGVLREVYNWFSVIAILMISVIICFNPKSIKDFFKLIFLTNISAFAVGGAGIGLFYFTNIKDLIGNMIGFSISGFSFKILLSSSCISYIIIKFFINKYKRIFIKKQVFCNVKIFMGKDEIELNALIDTGNSLHEPITNCPVIVAEFFAVKDILPDPFKIIFYEKKDNDLSYILRCITEGGYSNKIRLIPFSSLGKQNGMLLGIKVDKVEITKDNHKVDSNAIIGIYNFKLCKDGYYNALLNPEIFEL